MMRLPRVTPSISRRGVIMRSSLLLAPIFIAVLVGCATGPAYKRPDVSVPTKYKEGAGAPAANTPPAGWVRASPGATRARITRFEVQSISPAGTCYIDGRAICCRCGASRLRSHGLRQLKRITLSHIPEHRWTGGARG